jgi:hypothetical protein
MAQWRAYLRERFPIPVTLALAFATAYASDAIAGRGAGWELARGTALMFLLLFHLRVFDEHKDAALDAATRPDRPVQRGLVTLRELAVAGGVAMLAEVALGGTWWALPLGYSMLMLLEFGAPKWLERHYALYAISHSAITSAVCVSLVELAGGAGAAPMIVLGALALCSTMSIDVLRKTWAPSSEIDGVISWSKLLGIRGASGLGAGLLVGAGACVAWLANEVWVPAAVTLVCILLIAQFARKPTVRGEKMLQAVAGLHYLGLWIFLGAVHS